MIFFTLVAIASSYTNTLSKTVAQLNAPIIVLNTYLKLSKSTKMTTAATSLTKGRKSSSQPVLVAAPYPCHAGPTVTMGS